MNKNAIRRAEAVRLTRQWRGKGTLTPVRASNASDAVHLGFDFGTHETKPLCLALATRETETTDDPANCSGCASVAREAGLGHHLRDEDGWTGLYEPRRRVR